MVSPKLVKFLGEKLAKVIVVAKGKSAVIITSINDGDILPKLGKVVGNSNFTIGMIGKRIDSFHSNGVIKDVLETIKEIGADK